MIRITIEVVPFSEEQGSSVVGVAEMVVVDPPSSGDQDFRRDFQIKIKDKLGYSERGVFKSFDSKKRDVWDLLLVGLSVLRTGKEPELDPMVELWTGGKTNA